MMKISIIVPVYNVKDYLDECVESVVTQTYQNFELVLVDDGSTDGSDVLCDQYQEQYPQKLKVLHEMNGGPFRARLIGVQAATGDVVIFLDADDCLRMDALECIVRCFHENTCDMVLYKTGSWEKFSTIQINELWETDKIFEGESKKRLYEKIVCGEFSNNIWLKAIRAECADWPHRFSQYFLKNGEDLLLSVHFMTNCNKIVCLNEEIYYYRNRLGSAVHSFNTQRKESIKIVHTELEKYIDQWGMPELKTLHNARKVSGWISGLKLLMQNKKVMGRKAFKNELISISKDPYFCDAYNNMEKLKVSSYNRLLACLLYYKQYFLISVLYSGVSIVKKFKNRRKHDR